MDMRVEVKEYVEVVARIASGIEAFLARLHLYQDLE